MTSPSIVRTATYEDKAEVWRLFRACHAENGLQPMSEKKVDYYIDRLLNPDNITLEDNGPRGVIGVIGGKKLEGCIMLSFGTLWYSDEINMDEYLNFVDPDHRKSNHAITLISYAKHMVDQIRVAHKDFKLTIGVLSTKRTAAKVRLYERSLVPAGCFFVYPAQENIDPPRSLYRVK